MIEILRPWLDAIHAAGSIISAIAWLIIAILFARLLPQIRSLTENVQEISVAGPLSTNFSFKLRQSVEMLERVARDKLGSAEAIRHAGIDKRAGGLQEALSSSKMGMAGLRILWVDDNPSNNLHEEYAFRLLGADIARSFDSDEALERLSRESFDLIISDMGRPSGPQAGYALLKLLRERGDRTPYYIYSTSGDPKHADEAIKAGAQGSTNDPRILTAMIVSQLHRQS